MAAAAISRRDRKKATDRKALTLIEFERDDVQQSAQLFLLPFDFVSLLNESTFPVQQVLHMFIDVHLLLFQFQSIEYRLLHVRIDVEK